MEYSIKNNNRYESIEFNSSAIQTKGRHNIILRAKIGDNDYTNPMWITDLNKVTKLTYPEGVTLKLTSDAPFNYTIPGVAPKYYNKHKIENFLYEITYGNIDYDYAKLYFVEGYTGGCSVIRNKNLLGRNFDWSYNNQVLFIVHTPISLDRRGVLGVSGIIPGVEKSNVDDDDIIIDDIDMHKLIPFYLLDGINDKGVFCTHNIVPLDDEDDPTTIVYAKKLEKDRIAAPMLVRFVLDKFSTAKQAIDYLINYTTVYFTEDMIDAGNQSHFMIGDTNNTYIVEFIGGEIKIVDSMYMTNFPIDGVTFNEDNTIVYPNPTQSGINKYGSGLERWDIIANNYSTSNTKDGMRDLLELLYFSNAYGDPFWYSELVKAEDDDEDPITVDTDPSNCTTAKATALSNYASKSRTTAKVWITCHSSIYDIKKRLLYITNQEGDTEYIFNI